MWISEMARAGVVMLEQRAMATPSRVPAACKTPQFTFLNSLHPVLLANPNSALREYIHSNRALQSIATLAIVPRDHARQVFAQKV